MSFLERLDPDTRARVRGIAMSRTLAAGEYLVRQGERSRSLFQVVQGTLEARNGEGLLEVCEPGDMLGEIAFLDGKPRSADLVARTASQVMVWPQDALDRLMQDPKVRIALLEEVAVRQARAVRRLTDATAPPEPARPIPLETGVFFVDERVLERKDGERVKLSPTEGRLFAYLVSRPGRNIAYDTLLSEVWGYSRNANSRTVYVTVHRLRGKVEIDAKEPRHILSVTGVGYRFEP